MGRSKVDITVVEAFTVGNNEAYTGNPAAVVALEFDDDIGDEEKQKIAGTMNLSETAFIAKGWKRGEGALEQDPNDDATVLRRTLRWFTPKTEVPLCGHATVASAKAILKASDGQSSSIRSIEFASKFRGTLGAAITIDKETGDEVITLDFPSSSTCPVSLDSSWLSDFLPTLLGSQIQVQAVEHCPLENLLLVRLARSSNDNNEEEAPGITLAKVNPDFGALAKFGSEKTGGLRVDMTIVTIQGEGDDAGVEGAGRPHFYSRFFAPLYGINEDPVTGMAHSVLTPYWTRELGMRGQVLRARQASKRGGDLQCKLITKTTGTGEGEDEGQDDNRVSIGGRARIVLQGQLNL